MSTPLTFHRVFLLRQPQYLGEGVIGALEGDIARHTHCVHASPVRRLNKDPVKFSE